MAQKHFHLALNKPGSDKLINTLCNLVIGPGRFARAAHRIREGGSGKDMFHFTAWHDDALAGAVSFSAIRIGGQSGAFLLGPLVVHTAFIGQSCGLQLINEGLQEAKNRNGHLVLLVGDLPYYSKAGFILVPNGKILLPGPFDPQRLLAFECQPMALERYQGFVNAA